MIDHAATFFDLDGTLVVLEVDIERIRLQIAELFAAHGIARRFSPILETIELAARDVAEGGAVLRQRALSLLTEAECASAGDARFCPGAALAIAQARERGPVAIVSNNSRDAVDRVISRLGGEIVAVGREDGRAKPEPDLMEVAHRLVGARRGTYRVVGDAPTDIMAARAASGVLGRVESIAVLGGRGSRAQLEAAGPDRVIGDLGELWR